MIFRENYQNMGVNDKEWKTWKMFNEPVIQKIRFEETQRNYIGEVKDLSTVVNRVSSNQKVLEQGP